MTLHKPMRRPKLMLQKLLVALIVLSMFSLPTQVFAQDTGDGTDGSDGRAPNIFLPMLSDGSVETADMSADAEAAYNNDDGDDDAASKAIFFVADGLRQDMVEKYAAQRNVMPNMRTLLRNGVKAAGDGLLTEAPPNTGAGWYSLATGAWPGVHGSTNNTFHINGQPFTNRTAAFDLNVLQAESLAQAAERGGKKVAQIEWAGGREASIQGPTVDYRTFHSGRGVATNYISPTDDAAFVASFGLQFDHPAGFAGQAPFAGAAPTDASGWTNVPTSYSPAKEMRLRVLDFGADKYGLNAYIYDSRNNNKVDYDRVLLSFSKDGSQTVGLLSKGQWADVKVKIVDGALAGQDGRHAGQGRRTHQGPVPGAPVPHLGHTRDCVLAHVGRRARASRRRLRRVHRPEVRHLDGRRLCHSRGGHRQRGDLCTAGHRTGMSSIIR